MIKRSNILVLATSANALVSGYVLYIFPKNYDLLEIDARKGNYSVIGLLLGALASITAILGIVIYKEKRFRTYFGIELIASIVLLILWRRW